MALNGRRTKQIAWDIANIRIGSIVKYFIAINLVLLTVVYGLPSIKRKLTDFSVLPNVLSEQESRLVRINSYCESKDSNPFTRPHLNTMLVSHRYQALYCFVPGTGSSFWKRNLIELSHRGREFYGGHDEIHNKTVLHSYGLRILADLSPKQQDYISDHGDYFKFLFLRHPLIRIVSNFIYIINKIRSEKEFQMLQELILRYSTGNKIPVVQSNLPKDASIVKIDFEQFVNFITSYEGKQFSKELPSLWMSYNELCNPCHLKYDYIGQLESYSGDSNFLMKKMFNVTDFEDSDLRDRLENDKDVKVYLGQLNQSSMEKLADKYRDDMNMFGYQWQDLFNNHKEYK